MNCKNCGYGLKQRCGDFEKIICTYEEGECVKITELEQQKNWLEGCKSELGEHLGKANNRIVELEKENAELKAVERMALYSKMSDRLAKAEELLLELYDCIPSSMADSCKETLQKVALFFKDSEVEK